MAFIHVPTVYDNNYNTTLIKANCCVHVQINQNSADGIAIIDPAAKGKNL